MKASIPELPNAKRVRFAKDFRLQEEDIERLVDDKDSAEFFEACVQIAPQLKPRSVINWMLTDLYAWLKNNDTEINDILISPANFTALVDLVEKGTINKNTGKDVLNEMLESGKSAAEIVKERGLQQVSDDNLISEMIRRTLDQFPDEVQSYIDGKESVLNWLFGQVMRVAKGKANPHIVRKHLQELLDQKKG